MQAAAKKPATESESVNKLAPADEDKVASEIELIYNEANGLLIGIPAKFTATDPGVEG